MELTAKEIAQIEQYLGGDLRGEALVKFETRLEKDAAWAEEVETYRAVDGLLEEGRVLDMQDRIAEIENKLVQEKRNRRIWLGTAATLLVLLLPLGYFLLSNTLSGPAMFDTYFEVYTLGGPSRDNPEQTAYLEAWEQYKNGDFKQALPFFESVQESDSLYQSIQIYKGVCYLGNSDLENAEKIFGSYRYRKDSEYQEAADFYLALTYLKGDRKREALGVLQELQELGSTYKATIVQEMIDKLE